LSIFNVIFPVFAIALGGYSVARAGILSRSDISGLSRFVFVIAFPILLFFSIATMELPENVDWAFLAAYYLVVLFIYGSGMMINKYVFSGTDKDQVTFGLGSCFSNLILVGLPIISSGLGEQAVLPLLMIVSVQDLILFPLTTFIVEHRSNQDGKSGMEVFIKGFGDLARNPIILSLLLGLVLNLLKIPLPEFLYRPMEIFSKAALPSALFLLGASLNEYRISGQLKESSVMVALKMVLQPLLVWVFAFHVFKLDPLWGSTAVMAAGMPIGVNSFLFARSYTENTKSLSTAILLSCIFAIFSQSVLLALFG